MTVKPSMNGPQLDLAISSPSGREYTYWISLKSSELVIPFYDYYSYENDWSFYFANMCDVRVRDDIKAIRDQTAYAGYFYGKTTIPVIGKNGNVFMVYKNASGMNTDYLVKRDKRCNRIVKMFEWPAHTNGYFLVYNNDKDILYVFQRKECSIFDGNLTLIQTVKWQDSIVFATMEDTGNVVICQEIDRCGTCINLLDENLRPIIINIFIENHFTKNVLIARHQTGYFIVISRNKLSTIKLYRPDFTFAHSIDVLFEIFNLAVEQSTGRVLLKNTTNSKWAEIKIEPIVES
jgi:hypothetical protein